MDLEIRIVEPIYPQYSGVLETCLALRYWIFEVLGSESVNPLSATYNLQQTTISYFAAFSKVTNKARYSMRIVYSHEVSCLNFFRKLGKVSQNLSSAEVVIGALRVKTNEFSIKSDTVKSG